MNKDDDLQHLCKIMDDEIYIFRELLKIEKLKNSMIIQQEVEELEEITEEEEKYVEQIAEKEKVREMAVSKLFKKYKIDKDKIFTSLLKTLPNDKSDIKHELKSKKNELVRNIKDLKTINSLNNRLLMDTIKFFNYTVNSLKSINDITYTRSSKNQGRTAYLVDRKA